LEIHYTSKHANWLTIAEIELSVLARQGLAHNIATIEDLCQQVKLWQAHLRSSILPNGLVVLNGVTLTVMECLPDRFSFALIPYIWEHTNLGEIQPGTYSTWRPISMGAT
jgi:Lumazine binding domain